MALIGYARVSTEDQLTARQLDELRTAGCSEIVEEHASGDRSRPVLAQTLGPAAAGRHTCRGLVRPARSLSHLLEVIEGLWGRAVFVCSPKDPVDTASSARSAAPRSL